MKYIKIFVNLKGAQSFRTFHQNTYNIRGVLSSERNSPSCRQSNSKFKTQSNTQSNNKYIGNYILELLEGTNEIDVIGKTRAQLFNQQI